jgi:hypothetical protein
LPSTLGLFFLSSNSLGDLFAIATEGTSGNLPFF